MADPIASPDFTQKSLEKSEQLEQSLDRSPHSSQAGALRVKTAPPSSGGALTTLTVGAAFAVLFVGGSFLVSKSIGQGGASGLTPLSISLPKPQVGDGVQAAASTNRISPPAASFVAPATRPALRGAAVKAPPEATLFSPTGMKALKECLEVEYAGGTHLAGASNSSPSTGGLLTGRRLVLGRLVNGLPDCRTLTKMFQIMVFTLLVIAILQHAAAALEACYMCGCKRITIENFKKWCIWQKKYTWPQVNTKFWECPENPNTPNKCLPLEKLASGHVTCISETKSAIYTESIFRAEEQNAYYKRYEADTGEYLYLVNPDHTLKCDLKKCPTEIDEKDASCTVLEPTPEPKTTQAIDNQDTGISSAAVTHNIQKILLALLPFLPEAILRILDQISN
eukprot:GHVT01024881.1.p1 GENE.GHVT01024881.1~~GHVT01024881.1.p1  ORF type:complete len:395 (+),score=41.93 GHVT01024881.1:42-1226(+)